MKTDSDLQIRDILNRAAFSITIIISVGFEMEHIKLTVMAPYGLGIYLLV